MFISFLWVASLLNMNTSVRTEPLCYNVFTTWMPFSISTVSMAAPLTTCIKESIMQWFVFRGWIYMMCANTSKVISTVWWQWCAAAKCVQIDLYVKMWLNKCHWWRMIREPISHKLLKGTEQVITLILDGRRVTTNDVPNQLQINYIVLHNESIQTSDLWRLCNVGSKTTRETA